MMIPKEADTDRNVVIWTTNVGNIDVVIVVVMKQSMDTPITTGVCKQNKKDGNSSKANQNKLLSEIETPADDFQHVNN